MTQTKYEPVGEENEVQEDVVPKQHSNRNTVHWVVHFVQLAILVAVLGVFYYDPWTHREKTTEGAATGISRDTSVTFTDDVYHGNSSPYVGLPSDEQDERWEQLYHQYVTIDEKQTQLSVYHQMWCLDFLRKMSTPYFYFPGTEIEELGRLETQQQHCIDQLRQYVMCNADITEMPFEEVDGVKIGSSRVEHKLCADYGALLQKY